VEGPVFLELTLQKACRRPGNIAMDKYHRRPAQKSKADFATEVASHTPMMAELYRRAEAELKRLEKLQPANPDSETESDPRSLLHELQVHQIELEMQNSALQEAQELLKQSLERYTDLYDFAPVAYFTLDSKGTIQQVNLAGARMFNVDRVDLIGRSFGNFLVLKMRTRFHAFLKAAFGGGSRLSGQFDLLGKVAPARSVNIDAQCASDRTQCRLVLVDIRDGKGMAG